MPPRTLSSAVALVGLASLTAVEAGGYSKRTESLRSASRAGLALVTSAAGSVSAEATYSLADYGVGPVPGLNHLCGRYELGPKGELVTFDLFEGPMSPTVLEQTVLRAKTRGMRPNHPEATVSLAVSEFSPNKLPQSCLKAVKDKDARSLLLASRML
jgi:hypothetical protein